MGAAKELTPDTLEGFVRTNRFAIVHFWAPWNGYDVQMKAILATQIPDELRRKLAVGELNADKAEHHERCRQQYEVRNLPFLAFYRDGELVETFTGLLKPDGLVERLSRILSSPSTT